MVNIESEDISALIGLILLVIYIIIVGAYEAFKWLMIVIISVTLFHWVRVKLEKIYAKY